MTKEVPTSTKRFGARYGRKTKLRFGQLDELQRARHKCPYCTNIRVKRVSVGVWHCEKCDSKFTGKAYTI